MKGQPLRILRFCGRNFSLFFQAASHFLPPELKVRLRGAQSSVQWYDNFTIGAELCAPRKRTFSSGGKKWLAAWKNRGKFRPQNRNIRIGCPSMKKFGLILRKSMNK